MRPSILQNNASMQFSNRSCPQLLSQSLCIVLLASRTGNVALLSLKDLSVFFAKRDFLVADATEELSHMSMELYHFFIPITELGIFYRGDKLQASASLEIINILRIDAS